MESKKYEELNKYEMAILNASLEQKMAKMAKEIEQISLALKMSVHIDTVYVNEETHGVSVAFFPKGEPPLIARDVINDGDLLGIIDEALKATPR